MEEENFDLSEVRFRHQVDMRYLHQGYELAIDCPETGMTAADKESLKAQFDARHKTVYGMSADDEDAEIVTFRLLAEITVPRLSIPKLASGDGDIDRARTETRPLYDLGASAFHQASVYDRAKLLAGDRINGPAVIEQFDSTTVITAAQNATVDPYGNIIIEKRA